MIDQSPPRLEAAADRLTTQLVLAELRMHHWVAGPFAWLDATLLADRTPITHTGPRQPAVHSALRLLHHTGHIQLTHLPPRAPPPSAGVEHRTHDTDTPTLHARLALTAHQSHHEYNSNAASLQAIAARLGRLVRQADLYLFEAVHATPS